jgi:hypothetical protein
MCKKNGSLQHKNARFSSLVITDLFNQPIINAALVMNGI